jgi:CheY-like chemotaxis protein
MNGTGADERARRFVLVVEPNVDDRFTVTMLLQQFGCTTCGAASAEEAVDFLSIVPPVALVSEAGKTGAALLAGIR